MSLQAFQKALADLIATPDLCRTMRAQPEQVLNKYELAPREQRRLVAIAHQRGMETSCTLYRVNRITPIYTILPLTCFLLGDSLIREATLFWENYRETLLQFKHEIDHFAEFLRGRLQLGEITNPYLAEILEFEQSVNLLRFEMSLQGVKVEGYKHKENSDLLPSLNPLMQLIPFRHEPAILLQLLMKRSPPPYNLREGEFYVLLDGTGEGVQVRHIDPKLAKALEQIGTDGGLVLSPSDIETLVTLGILIWQPFS